MKRRKRSITLIEVMIVILLIGLIGGALAFNMRGSLDEGKAFKSEQNMARLHDILMLEHAKGELTLSEIILKQVDIVKNSPFSAGSATLKDGWNEPFSITLNDNQDDLIIESVQLKKYHAKKKI